MAPEIALPKVVQTLPEVDRHHGNTQTGADVGEPSAQQVLCKRTRPKAWARPPPRSVVRLDSGVDTKSSLWIADAMRPIILSVSGQAPVAV